MYSDTSQLLGLLGAQGEPSMQSFANSNLRKVLLLSAASWFETRISNALQKFSTIHSNGHPGIESLIKRKAIERQYHTYFDWKTKKPGPFYALFGDVCGDMLKQLVKADADLKDALAAFLELGACVTSWFTKILLPSLSRKPPKKFTRSTSGPRVLFCLWKQRCKTKTLVG